jgi:hypothetical protein
LLPKWAATTSDFQQSLKNWRVFMARLFLCQVVNLGRVW